MTSGPAGAWSAWVMTGPGAPLGFPDLELSDDSFPDTRDLPRHPFRKDLARFAGQFLEKRCGIRRREIERFVSSFFLPVLNWPALRGRPGHALFQPKAHQPRVAVVIVAALGHRQLLLILRRPAHLRLRPRQFLGRVVSGHHRAAQVPAALYIQAHLQAQAFGFPQSVPVKRAPFRRHECRPVRHLLVPVLLRAPGIADQRAAEAFQLHLL